MKTVAALAFLLTVSTYPVAGGVSDDTLRAVPIPHVAFGDARAIAVDPFDALYVADAARHVVVKMNARGAIFERIGGPGSREGEFDHPSDVDPTNGLVLLVADAGNHRIQLFSRSHAFLGTLPLVRAPGDAGSRVTYRRHDADAGGFATGIPLAVASSGSNEIFAIDAERNAVLKWNENRRLTRVIGGMDSGAGALGEPVALWAGPESLLYVADRAAGSVIVYDHYGSHVRTLGSGALRDVRAVTGRGSEVLVALPSEIVVYSREGRRLRTLAVDMPEAIVDVAAASDGSLFAIGSMYVYRLAAAPLAGE